MSRVFVARDAALKREIVIKVLAPELAGGVSLERFQREIELAARLQHPNIVPVLAAGEAAGLPYYTMPFVVGESLRERIARAGVLPVRDTIAILRDVARALAYAHAHGVVHRDIKPDNVLLSRDYAVVADFGVAKAISAARSAADADAQAQSLTLTSLGVSLGTPAYMSPEQATGDPATDHRTDIYAFGVLAYEMLTGALPFGARTPQAMMVAHVTETPAPIASKRPGIPIPLAAVVMRCLEKDPAARPHSAEEIVVALDGLAISTFTAPSVAAVKSKPTDRRRLVLTVAVTAAVAAAVATTLVLSRRPPPAKTDPNTVVVLPFRVTATDTAIKSLHEGIADLIAAKLTGAIHTADTRRGLNAWRRAGGESDPSKDVALEVMRQVGAGLAIEGEVTQAGPSVTLSAAVIDLRSPGSRVTQSVTGAPAAIATLVDNLVTKLLAQRAGGSDRGARLLDSIPLPALQEYIAGQAAYRRGHYQDATNHFAKAVQIDSTFALAGLRLWLAAQWSLDDRGSAGRVLALAHRDQLGPIDRLLLHDAPDGQVDGCATRLARKESATQAAPDVPELWYDVADELLHCGAAMGVDDYLQRSLAGFNRALALDSSFTPALEHLPTIYAMTGDTAAARHALSFFPDTSDFLPFNQFFALSDSASRASARARLLLEPLPGLIATAQFVAAMVEPPSIDDSERFLRAAQAHAVTDADRRSVASVAHFVAMNLGQPSRGLAAANAAGLGPADIVADRIFWDGDSTAAVAALPALALIVSRTPSPADEEPWVTSAFAAAEYAISTKGPGDSDARLVAQLREFKGGLLQASRARRFALLLDAQRAVATKAPNAKALVTSADSMLRRVEGGRYNQAAGNLIVARLWESLSEPARAHAATLRVELGPTVRPFNSTMWRERARLAVAAGDTSDAIRAYRQYIAIRARADSILIPDLDNARYELARLEKHAAGR
jgi:serine/threonine-protein kinase